MLIVSYDALFKHYRTLIFFINLQELNKHIEDGLGKNLADRCSSEVNESMHQSQQEIIGNAGRAGC